MGSEIESLRHEIEVLKEDYKSLEEEVRRLRRAIAGLRAQDRLSGYPESEGSFSFLESAGGGASVIASSPARSLGSVEARTASASGLATAATVAPGPLSWGQREDLAEGIGAWIRRSLNGEHRGTSGRDRNPLQSRLWIVARSIEGEDFNPPLIFKSWTAAKALVKRGPETGGSIFVGIPSEREAVRIVRSAGLIWSGTFNQ